MTTVPVDLDWLREKLDHICTKIEEVKSAVKRNDADIEKCQGQRDDTHREIFGRLNQLEKTQGVHGDYIEEQRRQSAVQPVRLQAYGVWFTVAVAILTFFLTFIGTKWIETPYPQQHHIQKGQGNVDTSQ